MLGSVGRGFPRRLYRTWGSSFCIVRVSVESFTGWVVPLLLRVGVWCGLGVEGKEGRVVGGGGRIGGGVHGVRYR